MKLSSILSLAFAVMACLFAAGCTASSELEEETGNQQTTPRDTVVAMPVVVKTPVPAQSSKQGFTTKEDTIEVESAQRNRRPEHTPVVVQQQAPSLQGLFGVQVGAFKAQANAQRLQAVLSKRFNKQATIVFDEGLKLYKVSVGAFATEKEAIKFAAMMKKRYPKEYRHAWVIRRPV